MSFIHEAIDILEALGIDHPIAREWTSSARRSMELMDLLECARRRGVDWRVRGALWDVGNVAMARRIAVLDDAQISELNAAADRLF